MERQSAEIDLRCATCHQSVHACTCTSSSTMAMSIEPSTLAVPVESRPPAFASPARHLSDPVHQANRCQVGSVIADSYELISELGVGGMGAVYQARHVSMPKLYAVKILKHELNNDPDFRQRFEQEARTASILNHPHLVSISDYGTTVYGESYLVMDFIAGHSLADRLKSINRMEQKQAVQIFMQICAGLSHAHELGIIHRDLKPSNVMILDSDEAGDFVKVVDFGIAKMLVGESSVAYITQAITKTGEFFGSPLYMSPEQGAGGMIDLRSDIYSLGVLMYECLTAAPPFRGDNFFFTMVQHSEAQPRPFNVDLGINKDLEKIVLKTLEKNPDDRYQTMDQLRQALADLISQDKPCAKKRSATKKELLTGGKPLSRTMILVTTCLVLLLVLVGGATFWLKGKSSDRQESIAPPVVTISPAKSRADSALHPEILAALPAIPDSVQLPEIDQSLDAVHLVIKGDKMAQAQALSHDWRNLLPARYYGAAIDRAPSQVWAYERLKEFYWQCREQAPTGEKAAFLNDCLKVSDLCVQRFPENLNSYWSRCTYYMVMKDRDRALADVNMALKLAPTRAELHIKRGEILRALHQYGKAIEDFKPYVDGTKPGLLYLLGTCYIETGQYATAIEFCDKWLKKNPNNIGLLIIRGDYQLSKHQYQKALNDFEKYKLISHEHERDQQIDQCRKKLGLQGN